MNIKYFLFACALVVPFVMLFKWSPLAGLLFLGLIVLWARSGKLREEPAPTLSNEEIEKELPEVIEDGTPAGVVTDDNSIS